MRILLLNLMLLVWSGSLHADVGSSAKQVREMQAAPLDPRLVNEIQRDPSSALKRALRRLYTLAPAGVLNREILRNLRQTEAAAKRAAIQSQYLRYDLNNDGRIDQSEIAQQMSGFSAEHKTALIAFRFLADRNADAEISADEISLQVNRLLDEQDGKRPRNEPLFDYDRNGDGEVSTQDIIETIELALRQPKKVEHIKRKTQERQRKAEAELNAKKRALEGAGLPEICAYPEKSQAAELQVLSAKQGAALSTVAIMGRQTVTSVARLVIEEGEQPLYLVVGAETPVIWDVTGAVERIERLVLPKGNAAMGLSVKKVHFTEPTFCAPDYSNVSGRKVQGIFKDTLQVAFNMLNFMHHAEPKVDKLLWPSRKEMLGQSIFRRSENPAFRTDNPSDQGKAPDGPVRNDAVLMEILEWKLRAGYSEGVRQIDPERVILEGDALPYVLLPKEAGLMQMVERGEIWGTASGTMIIAKPLERLPIWGDTAPASFYLEEGMEYDRSRGNLAEFRVFELGSRRCISGPACGRYIQNE